MKILRMVLLIVNGALLVLLVVSFFLALMRVLMGPFVPAALVVIPLVFGLLFAGNVAYILRCPPRTKHASDRQLIETF